MKTAPQVRCLTPLFALHLVLLILIWQCSRHTAGDAALEDLHLNNDEGSLWASFLFLFMQFFFFHTLAYTFLRLTAGRKKA